MTNRSVLLVTLAAVAVLTVAPLLAHLGVSKSDPAHESTVSVSPKAVTVWFTQNPVLAVSAFTLEGPDGAVTLGAVQAGPERSLTAEVVDVLRPGPHTLTWRTAGNDGHVISGTRTFTYAPAAR
jgi:copper resistance protein C